MKIMADFTYSKGPLGSPGMIPGTQAVEFREIEPLITPDILRSDYLFGVPLVAPVPDPITGKAVVMSDTVIQRQIERAIAYVENVGICVFERQVQEKKEWDIGLFNSFGYMKLNARPCSAIQELSIVPANNIPIFSIPLEWIETSRLALGQINIIPINIASFNGSVQVSNGPFGGGGAFWLGQGITNYPWVASYWRVTYTAGFPANAIPRIINAAIGLKASLIILHQMQAARSLINSESLGIDGLSQSTSGPGNQTYLPTIKLLQEELDNTMRRIKVLFGMTLYASDVG